MGSTQEKEEVALLVQVVSSPQGVMAAVVPKESAETAMVERLVVTQGAWAVGGSHS